jgi:hypothetical protein
VRRRTIAAFALVATAAVLTASAGTASAQDRKSETHGKTAPATVEHKKPKAEKPRHPKVEVVVTMTGVVTDTPTAGIAVPASTDSPVVVMEDSPATEVTPTPAADVTPTPAADPTAGTLAPAADPAVGTLTIAVKGGERSLHRVKVVLTVDGHTVVRRGDAPATVADLRPGDHVSVRARRLPDGGWLALRVNAAPRRHQD